ncbi:MAG: TolC family protein [Gemmatimonadaceae bacterium]
MRRAHPQGRDAFAVRLAALLAPLLAALLALSASPGYAQTPDSLSLGQALDRARAARPQVTVAAAAVERARGARRVAGVIPNPSAQLERDDLAPTNKLTVVQSFAWLPRRGADLAAGRALVERAAADSAQLIADLARDVRLAFYAALAGEERLRLAAEQVALADSLIRLAERRVSAGDISELERDQVAQEASRARLASSRAREEARVARTNLARAVAWESGPSGAAPRPAGALADGLDTATTAESPAAVAAEARALAELPALRAALADSAAAAARLRAARLAQIPIPSLLAGREWGGDTSRRSNATFGFALPIPLLSQGREAVAEARGAAVEGAARAAETRLALAAQLSGARVRLEETAARARFARDSLVPEARRIRVGAVRLYEAGRTGVLPVFDALRAEREVDQTLVGELVAFQRARADLTALLGRWQ